MTITYDTVNQKILEVHEHWKANKDKPIKDRSTQSNYLEQAKHLKDRHGNFRYPDLHDEYFDELKARGEQVAEDTQAYSLDDLQTKLGQSQESLLDDGYSNNR